MSSGMINKKKKMGNLGIDRLSSLPEELVIHILSFLDTKSAIQTSVSLKKWVNLWTLLPGLHFDISVFKNSLSFHKFVRKVLTLRKDSKTIKLNYSRGQMEVAKSKLLKFIALHQVNRLTFDASILVRHRFLESFKLHECWIADSLCLKQVVTLHLEKCGFIQPKNFSGCPNLKNLRLIDCVFESDVRNLGNLSINSPQLSSLTIWGCCMCYFCASNVCDHKLMLSTPRLAYFTIGDFSIPLIQSDDLASLDTVDVIIDMSYFPKEMTLNQFSKLISSLKCFRSAKSVRLSSDVVKLLSEFPDVLEAEPSPFCNLKNLNVIPNGLQTSSVRIPFHVMKYLLEKSPQVDIVVKLKGGGIVRTLMDGSF